jgi:hypothetical protein
MLTPRPSIPIGGDRALVRIDSGEYVCVDLRSLDSLMFLLNWDLDRPAEFIGYIHDLGFRICRILPGSELRLAGLEEEITGLNNCLLTRTPEADIAAVERRRRSPLLRLKRFALRHAPSPGYYRRMWHRL